MVGSNGDCLAAMFFALAIGFLNVLVPPSALVNFKGANQSVRISADAARLSAVNTPNAIVSVFSLAPSSSLNPAFTVPLSAGGAAAAWPQVWNSRAETKLTSGTVGAGVTVNNLLLRQNAINIRQENEHEVQRIANV